MCTMRHLRLLTSSVYTIILNTKYIVIITIYYLFYIYTYRIHSGYNQVSDTMDTIVSSPVLDTMDTKEFHPQWIRATGRRIGGGLCFRKYFEKYPHLSRREKFPEISPVSLSGGWSSTRPLEIARHAHPF